MGALILAFVFFLVYVAVICGICAVMFWKLFEKAGQPGWASMVPFYNLMILMKVAGRPWWWAFLFFIPIANLVVSVLSCLDIAKNFGKDTGFAIGLILLGIVFFPLLGFGDAEYNPTNKSLV